MVAEVVVVEVVEVVEVVVAGTVVSETAKG